MKDDIRAALIQPKPYPTFDDPKNLVHALLLLEKCRGEQLDVICFPELFPYQGEEALAQAARQCNAYIIAGLVEEDGSALYNTATVFDRTGRIVGRQRKRNVGALERNQLGLTPGDGVFRAIATDFGKIGAPVCIDFWGQPEAAKQLADQGADVIFNPSIFPVVHGQWKTGAQARVFDNFIAAVGVNTADYNALVQGKRVHQKGGGSFIMAPPRILDKDDFRKWLRSLDSSKAWLQVELTELEQVHIASINLTSVRRFRKDFWNRFGFHRMQ
ncbi:MAG: carbon-nitrogen hydrolase family protein [Syntrophobacteraceae bacterium]|jgi:predicted amidohydrolase